MKALTWHGTHDVRVDTVPDPRIQDPGDAILKVTAAVVLLQILLGNLKENSSIEF